MSRIQKLFDRKRAGRDAALIAYVTAGDPSPERTPSIAAALERGGADLIELGVPFSDPIADGPVIQMASGRALAAGTNLAAVLDSARQIRKSSEIPILLFSYLNPLLRYGFERLAKDARAAGIDGVLMTDLSVEEAAEYVKPVREAGLDTVFLAAPTSPPERLRLVAEHSSGFVYLVSRTGVTGVRSEVSAAVEPLVKAMRQATKLPLAVGFGVASGDHAASVARLADGVVVGSAFVKIAGQYGASPELEAKLEALARELKGGIGRA